MREPFRSPRPSRFITPGVKFSTTTSAVEQYPRPRTRLPGQEKVQAQAFLVAVQAEEIGASPSISGAGNFWSRHRFPAPRSLMTAAPISATSWVHKGPLAVTGEIENAHSPKCKR